MSLKNNFIKATEMYNTFEENVPAYLFRGSFEMSTTEKVSITVAARGFYELYFNGERITRGFLSPYVSNPNHYVYYDEYEVETKKGENVVGIVLGNGFQNNPGGYIWKFDKADFRGAPSFALSITRGTEQVLVSDTSFKIAQSPILFDDYRFGEHYDANFEIDGWKDIGFDDSAWENALLADAPLGELRAADIPPIV